MIGPSMPPTPTALPALPTRAGVDSHKQLQLVCKLLSQQAGATTQLQHRAPRQEAATQQRLRVWRCSGSHRDWLPEAAAQLLGVGGCMRGQGQAAGLARCWRQQAGQRQTAAKGGGRGGRWSRPRGSTPVA